MHFYSCFDKRVLRLIYAVINFLSFNVPLEDNNSVCIIQISKTMLILKKSKLVGSLNMFQTIIKRLCSKQNPQSTKEHQQKIMSKGLPIKKPINGVKNILLVSSGKGGVGKSTTAVNLATAMKATHPNLSVGLLDTDVFGPSIPLMMNLHETPLVNTENLMIPLINYGVKCMSMGFLIEEGAPVIWRGLMVMQALEKLLRQVDWGSVDCLVVDTPPGTGDTHLSLVQNVPITGVVLVTTPQPASLQVTKRGAIMYKKLSVPIVGLVENMSSITCPSCQSCVKIFGEGTRDLAAAIGADIIQSFPLDQEISTCTDGGTPLVVQHPEGAQAKLYVDLSDKVVDFLKRNKTLT